MLDDEESDLLPPMSLMVGRLRRQQGSNTKGVVPMRRSDRGVVEGPGKAHRTTVDDFVPKRDKPIGSSSKAAMQASPVSPGDCNGGGVGLGGGELEVVEIGVLGDEAAGRGTSVALMNRPVSELPLLGTQT